MSIQLKLQALLPQVVMCLAEGGFFFVVYCFSLALASVPTLYDIFPLFLSRTSEGNFEKGSEYFDFCQD